MEITKFDAAFPESLNFYGLAEVTQTAPETAKSLHLQDCFHIGIQLLGEQRGIFIFNFDQGLEREVCKEIANVLASKFADNLATDLKQETMISPPKILQERTYIRLETDLTYNFTFTRAYFHVYLDKVIPFMMTLKLVTSKEHIYV